MISAEWWHGQRTVDTPCPRHYGWIIISNVKITLVKVKVTIYYLVSARYGSSSFWVSGAMVHCWNWLINGWFGSYFRPQIIESYNNSNTHKGNWTYEYWAVPNLEHITALEGNLNDVKSRKECINSPRFVSPSLSKHRVLASQEWAACASSLGHGAVEKWAVGDWADGADRSQPSLATSHGISSSCHDVRHTPSHFHHRIHNIAAQTFVTFPRFSPRTIHQLPS